MSCLEEACPHSSRGMTCPDQTSCLRLSSLAAGTIKGLQPAAMPQAAGVGWPRLRSTPVLHACRRSLRVGQRMSPSRPSSPTRQPRERHPRRARRRLPSCRRCSLGVRQACSPCRVRRAGAASGARCAAGPRVAVCPGRPASGVLSALHGAIIRMLHQKHHCPCCGQRPLQPGCFACCMGLLGRTASPYCSIFDVACC